MRWVRNGNKKIMYDLVMSTSIKIIMTWPRQIEK